MNLMALIFFFLCNVCFVKIDPDPTGIRDVETYKIQKEHKGEPELAFHQN